MKCIIKSTGEVVDVFSWSATGIYTDYVNSNGEAVTSKLDYNKDFVFIENELTSGIDWENRRYEIAKAILTGYSSGEGFYSGVTRPAEHCACAIEYADELINQLKAKQ